MRSDFYSDPTGLSYCPRCEELKPADDGRCPKCKTEVVQRLMDDDCWVKMHYTNEQLKAYAYEAAVYYDSEWVRRLGSVLNSVRADLDFYRSFRPRTKQAYSLERAILVAKAWKEHGKDCKKDNCPVRVAAHHWGFDEEDKEKNEEV